MPKLSGTNELGRAHSDRARQFMPFAALRGFDTYVRDEVAISQSFHELTEDEALTLSRTLQVVGPGDVVGIRAFIKGSYTVLRAQVERVDDQAKCLYVVPIDVSDDEKIDMSHYTLKSARMRISFTALRSIEIMGYPYESI